MTEEELGERLKEMQTQLEEYSRSMSQDFTGVIIE